MRPRIRGSLEARRPASARVHRPGLALAAAALLAAPALGAPSLGVEELYAFVSEGLSWHWVDVTLTAPGLLRAQADIVPRTAANIAGGLWLLDAQGEVLQRSVDAEWALDFLQVDAMVAYSQVAGVHVTRGPSSPALQVDAVLAPGTYRVVAVFGGDSPDIAGELRLGTDAPASVGATATGAEVLFAREYDLEAFAGLGLSLPARPLSPLEVRIVNQASTALTAERSLFGQFEGQANLLLDMALVTPEGVQNGATSYALDNAGHGAFQFLLRTFVDAAPPGCDVLGCARSGVWLLLGDVAL